MTQTNAELKAENQELRDRVAALESGTATRPAPARPSFGMSEGTRLEIVEAQRRVATTDGLDEVILRDPFDSSDITVTAHGVTHNSGAAVDTDAQDD